MPNLRGHVTHLIHLDCRFRATLAVELGYYDVIAEMNRPLDKENDTFLETNELYNDANFTIDNFFVTLAHRPEDMIVE